jgi:hypothetical protein
MHASSRGVGVALWIAAVVAAFGIGWITPPPYGPSAPDDLVASLRSALGEGDVIERQGLTASLLKRLDPFDMPEVAALYERMIPVIDPSELAAFFAAWARLDTVGALDHALSWSLPEMQESREIGVRAAIQVWAQRDPSAARLAAEQIGTDTPTLRGALHQALVKGWVHSAQGQEGLAAFIADRPPLRPRIELVEMAVRELVRAGGAEAALGWAEPILREEAYKPAFKHSVFTAAAGSVAQWDPKRAAAWVLEHAGADYAKEGVVIVAEHWGRMSGAAAMAWLGEQPAGELRDEAVREAFGQWSRANPRRARDWLNAEESAVLRDPALEFKAQRMVAHEPEWAIDRCERIQDTTRRQICLESTAKSWYAKDPVAAETWLQQSPLDEEARSRVREIPKPQGQQGQQGQQRRGPRRPRAPGDPR